MLTKLLRTRFSHLYGVTALTFLIASSPAWSISVSPSPSYDGNYTVSSGEELGCTYYPQYFVYECYYLMESVGGAAPTVVADTGWSKNFSGKAAGSYEYQILQVIGGLINEQSVVEGPVTVEVGLGPIPQTEDQEYATRHGDIDYDGDLDIYVKRVAGTSWQLPLEEFILRQNSNNTFTVDPTVTSGDMVQINQWDVSMTYPELVDFNADGYIDLLLTGLDVAGVGPHDVVVFASDAPLAPPLSARLMDESIETFARDLMGYLHDPSYLSGAYQYSCNYSWSTYPLPQWDIDGSLAYIGIPWLTVSCNTTLNPSYSPAAVGMAYSVNSVLYNAEMPYGSGAGETIANYFEPLLSHSSPIKKALTSLG